MNLFADPEPRRKNRRDHGAVARLARVAPARRGAIGEPPGVEGRLVSRSEAQHVARGVALAAAKTKGDRRSNVRGNAADIRS